MNKEEEMALMDYLYPNEEVRTFMCNDVYQELLENIPATMIISTENVVESKRTINRKRTKDKIISFFMQHQNYKKTLLSYYGLISLNDDIIDEIVLGLTFYLAKTDKRCKDVDIFKDKKSICYQDIAISDFFDEKPKNKIKIEDIVFKHFLSVGYNQFESNKLRLDAVEFEKQYRESLSNKEKQDLSILLDKIAAFHSEREYEIVCYVIDFLRTFFQKR